MGSGLVGGGVFMLGSFSLQSYCVMGSGVLADGKCSLAGLSYLCCVGTSRRSRRRLRVLGTLDVDKIGLVGPCGSRVGTESGFMSGFVLEGGGVSMPHTSLVPCGSGSGVGIVFSLFGAIVLGPHGERKKGNVRGFADCRAFGSFRRFMGKCISGFCFRRFVSFKSRSCQVRVFGKGIVKACTERGARAFGAGVSSKKVVEPYSMSGRRVDLTRGTIRSLGVAASVMSVIASEGGQGCVLRIGPVVKVFIRTNVGCDSGSVVGGPSLSCSGSRLGLGMLIGCVGRVVRWCCSGEWLRWFKWGLYTGS